VEGKHTETQYLTWFGKTAYIHGRESILFRDRERITTQYMEEEDHFTQTQLPALLLHLQLLQWQQGCCHCSPSLSLYSLHIITTLHILLSLSVPFYRQQCCHQLLLFFNKGGCQLQPFFNNDGCQPLTSWMGAHGWCNSSCSCCHCQWLLTKSRSRAGKGVRDLESGLGRNSGDLGSVSKRNQRGGILKYLKVPKGIGHKCG